MKHIVLSLFALVLLALPSVSFAGEPRLMATYGDWEVYVFFEGGNKVCYIASQPKQEEGDYTKRGQPFALITNRPAENTSDVFSYITGYSYKAGSDALMEIDDQTFKLFTQDENAWAPDSKMDRAIAEAIKSGTNMVVKGTSSRGTLTTDVYGLSGSSKAYERMNDECK